MVLTKHKTAWFTKEPTDGKGCLQQYRIDGLAPGEHALIGEFPDHGWRILRWNEEWHGNWSGHYSSVDDALTALREELLTAVA